MPIPCFLLPCQVSILLGVHTVIALEIVYPKLCVYSMYATIKAIIFNIDIIVPRPQLRPGN